MRSAAKVSPDQPIWSGMDILRLTLKTAMEGGHDAEAPPAQ